MYLMLYAPYGRTGVYMFQDYCRRLGVGTSPQEIDDLTMTLRLLSQHHPLVLMMRGSREGLDANALIDAVLNPRDRTYSVPQLFECVERNDLKFARWYWQAAYLPQCGAISHTPHASRLAALPELEQYTEMELWRGLMTNHDFVVQRSDAKDDEKINFNGQQHLRYVPIRRAWTMCTTDDLPPGAAGVVLNRCREPMTTCFDELARMQAGALFAPTEPLPYWLDRVDQPTFHPFRWAIPLEVGETVIEMNRSRFSIEPEPAPIPHFEGEDVGSRRDFEDHAVLAGTMAGAGGYQKVVVFLCGPAVHVFMIRKGRTAGLG